MICSHRRPDVGWRPVYYFKRAFASARRVRPAGRANMRRVLQRTPMIELTQLEKHYGEITALRGISTSIDRAPARWAT